MFSLRSLRIKAMQQIFALFIQKKANLEKGEKILIEPTDSSYIQKNLIANIKIFHHLHSSFLQLMTTWAAIEHKRASSLFEKPLTPLYNDPFLTSLRQHPLFEQLTTTHPLIFPTTLVERWYDLYIRDEPYNDAQEKDNPSSTLTSLPLYLIKKIFTIKEIQDITAQKDLFWEEDRHLIYQRLRRFIKDFAQDPTESFALYESSLSAEKINFHSQLIAKTLELLEEHESILEKHLLNWSLDRINIIDQILIRMALTEISCFPDIPKKVSINEYLEIAKQYSTPQSASFINGVVDHIN